MTAPADTQLPIKTTPPPPHLVWPVSRREFYRAIAVALLPSLAWGLILFGFRPLSMLISACLAALLMHVFLKQTLKWKRAQFLIFPHTLVSTLILVALAQATWPAWAIAGIALLLPFFLALQGGPGRERIHLPIVAVLLLQFVLFPYLARVTYTGLPDALLARDRLIMGDIRNQRPTTLFAHAWPASRQIAGDDAFPVPLPAVTAMQTLDQISAVLPTEHPGQSEWLSRTQASAILDMLDRALVMRLPPTDLFILGIAPNRVGAASLIAITLAGLFLSYRYVLRPRSLLIFLGTFLAAGVLLTFTPATVHRAGPLAVWELFHRFPAPIVSLITFYLLNSDAPFAAVYLLALPGTAPLTPRPLRLYLIIAALLAAALHRFNPAIPAASLVLTAMMPLAPLFDRFFARSSWLNA